MKNQQLKNDITLSKSEAKPKESIDKKTDIDVQKLAKRIRALRKKTHTNADFFAYENEISRAQYARYEAGENIRFTSLMKIIKAFGLTPQEFFSEGFD